MPITIREGDILQSDADIFVIPVNTAGVISTALAIQFYAMVPRKFQFYQRSARAAILMVGESFSLWDTDPITRHRRLLMFLPLKDDWTKPCTYKDIETGLQDVCGELHRYHSHHHLRTVAIPALGCGHSGLDWGVIKMKVIEKLDPVKYLDIFLYPPRNK